MAETWRLQKSLGPAFKPVMIEGGGVEEEEEEKGSRQQSEEHLVTLCCWVETSTAVSNNDGPLSAGRIICKL